MGWRRPANAHHLCMQVDQAPEFHRFDASTANTQILCRLTDEALEFIVSRRRQAMTETHFRRVHACAISQKRMLFETLFEIGACLCKRHERMLAARSTRQTLCHRQRRTRWLVGSASVRKGSFCATIVTATRASTHTQTARRRTAAPPPTTRIGRRLSSPETNSMAGRVCVHNERHFLRNYHHSPMSFHALKHAIDEKGEHQHEGA